MRRLALPLALTLALSALVGCDPSARAVDARFATPERTIATLFTAYGLEGASQAEVRQRLIEHRRFELRDPESYRASFADLATPADEGLAGFVLGALAAGKDQLETRVDGDRATVSPRPGFDVVLARATDGRWRIVLAESVPPEVRTRMSALAADYELRQLRGESLGAAAR